VCIFSVALSVPIIGAEWKWREIKAFAFFLSKSKATGDLHDGNDDKRSTSSFFIVFLSTKAANKEKQTSIK
jgi:hypothetical protein